MKSRTTKTSVSQSKQRKGLSRTAKVFGATTVGALAGVLVGAAITNRKRASSAVGKTTRKLKGWAKSAVTNPAVKSLAKGVARQVVASQLGDRPRKGQSMSATRMTMKDAGKAKRKR